MTSAPLAAPQLSPGRPVAQPARPPAGLSAAGQVALRALRKYIRTPGLSVMGIVQSALFLFCFRYVFGGAIHAGSQQATGHGSADSGQRRPAELVRL